MKSNVWVHFHEYAPDALFMGGQPASRKIVSVQLYAIRGGLSAGAKKILIEGATRILAIYGGLHEKPPVFIAIHELSEVDWGSFAVNPNLGDMRASSWDAPAL